MQTDEKVYTSEEVVQIVKEIRASYEEDYSRAAKYTKNSMALLTAIMALDKVIEEFSPSEY